MNTNIASRPDTPLTQFSNQGLGPAQSDTIDRGTQSLLASHSATSQDQFSADVDVAVASRSNTPFTQASNQGFGQAHSDTLDHGTESRLTSHSVTSQDQFSIDLEVAIACRSDTPLPETSNEGLGQARSNTVDHGTESRSGSHPVTSYASHNTLGNYPVPLRRMPNFVPPPPSNQPDFDTIDDTNQENAKDLKKDVRDIKNLVRTYHEDVKTTKEHHETVIGMLKEIKTKLGISEPTTNEHQSEEHQHVQTVTSAPRRRSENAHTSSGQTESNQQHQAGSNQISNNAQVNSGSVRRGRSVTPRLDGSERPSAVVDPVLMHRFNGPAPDLENHPAFRNERHVNAESSGSSHGGHRVNGASAGLPFGAASLGENVGWYDNSFKRHGS